MAVSQWMRIYGGGGGFLFDELDAANENLLMLVNAALANGYFSNAATGEIIKKHPNFFPMAGMNTLGLGAGRDYNSRNKLDAATLDRWNAGRVIIELDEQLEAKIFWQIVSVPRRKSRCNHDRNSGAAGIPTW
jgi:cobaltochelatase CobS